MGDTELGGTWEESEDKYSLNNLQGNHFFKLELQTKAGRHKMW